MKQLKMLRYPKRRFSMDDVKLPEGFRIETHTDARVIEWLEICDSLNGGDHSFEKFKKTVLDYPDVAPERIFYAVTPDGRAVATAIARWRETEKSGGLHMVEAKPECRGLGLGRAVCTAATASLDALGTTLDRLTTDDFRIPAIKIYLSLGYVPFLYADDMKERWAKVLAGLGYAEYETADADEKVSLAKLG